MHSMQGATSIGSVPAELSVWAGVLGLVLLLLGVWFGLRCLQFGLPVLVHVFVQLNMLWCRPYVDDPLLL